MGVYNSHENKTTRAIESEFNKLNISNKDSNPINTNYKNLSHCNNQFTEELWCKDCEPLRMVEGWTSGNPDIDKFIKDTMYDANNVDHNDLFSLDFLEWVPFDRLTDIKPIGEGGFSKVYTAIWIDGKSKFSKQDDGSWKKLEPETMKVALKRLNGSQNMSAEYLNEVLYICIDFFLIYYLTLIIIILIIYFLNLL